MPSSARRNVKEKGFYILPRELFANVRAAAHPTTRTSTRPSRAVFKNIEGSAIGTDSEDDVKGLFDDLDVNSSKLGPRSPSATRSSSSCSTPSATCRSARSSDNTIDLFGDAYEYLMQMYASSAGKSGGEYYTPQEVSELLARITVVGKTEVNKVYDPAAGRGRCC
jgi:type I restriction enzyme M protein